MATILSRLGQFCADFIPEQLPPSVLKRVRLQHLHLASAIRAVSDRPLAAALSGSGAVASVRRSATLGGWLEQDDILLGGRTGVGAVPAAWALSEGRSVQELLTAVALANEVAGRIGAAALLGPGLTGTEPMVTSAAAAVAAARLLSLSGPQTASAIALSLASAPALQPPRGTPADALRTGHAARAGLEAALMARDGVVGDLGLLDADDGPLTQRCWLPLKAAFTGLGSAWLTETLAFKLDPLALHAQVPVQAAREILRRHIKAADKRLRIDQLAAIEIRTTSPSAAMAQRPWPLRPTTVPHSIRHAIGVLMTTNELTPQQLTDDWLAANHGRIGTVAARITVIYDPARTLTWLTRLIQVAAPLFAGVTVDEIRDVLRQARSQHSPLPAAPGGALALLKARPDQLLERIRYSTGDLADARLDELQFRGDTEVKLFTTRGGSWPERRTIPEGSPGWSWQDTVSRALTRHGADDAQALLDAPLSADGQQWAAALLG